jgi:glycerol transport system ATP-binding protein
VPIAAQVDLAEISGSETYVHARRGELALVAQLGGVHNLDIGSACTVYCQPHALFIFADDGGLLFAPGVAKPGVTTPGFTTPGVATPGGV